MKRATMALLAVGAMHLGASSAAFAESAHGGRGGDIGDDALWSQADAHYDPAEMSEARARLVHHSGSQINWFAMTDRLETQFHNGENTLLWDTDLWVGGDINKLWVKSEGEFEFDAGAFDEAEVQALWSRAISRYFDLQAGVRYDIEPDGAVHGVIGLQGLAPYWFEIDAAAFVSDDGDVTARLEGEYELLLAQRLILQPRFEIEFSAQDIPDRSVGAGVTGIDTGMRLRYEVIREIAPYVGFEWRGAFGDTADYIRAAGGEPRDLYFVAGLRLWY